MSTKDLNKLKLNQLKEKARALGLNPTGDKRRRETWINALIAAQPVTSVTPVTPAPTINEEGQYDGQVSACGMYVWAASDGLLEGTWYVPIQGREEYEGLDNTYMEELGVC